MNKKLILWTAAVIITFLTAFVHQRLSPYYPLSGSIAVDGERVTYLFNKIQYGKDTMQVLIRKDIDGLKGNLFWKYEDEDEWKKTQLTESGKFLKAHIKPHKSGAKIEYHSELVYKEKMYDLPPGQNAKVYIAGRRPAAVMYNLYFFLFGGLLLSVRGALEYFNPDDKRRLFPILAAMFFFVASIIFYPFIRSYEMDVINKSIPQIGTLFDTALLLLFIIWFISAVAVSIYKHKIILLIAGILTIVIYQFSNFY
jgi:hypothetical protein